MEPPPISERGGKWSPLGLAFFSLLCDPLMIPSILAISRAVGDLNEIARRERSGLYRDEHAQARTGAVWAIVIGGARPLLLVVMLLIAGVSAALAPPMHPVLPADELSEILDRLRAEDRDVRGLAYEHLFAIGASLSAADVDRVLDAADEGFGHFGHEDADTEHRLRSLAVGAAAQSHAVAERYDRFARVYPTLDVHGREALLIRLVEVGSPDALRTFASLAGADHDPYGPYFDMSALVAHRADAALFVAPLVHLPADARLRGEVPLLLSRLCRAGLSESVLAPVRDRLIADWREPVAPSNPRWRTIRARHLLGAFECVRGEDVDALLVEASADPTPLVAVAAVRALLARGQRVDRAAIARLAADPLSRADLFLALHRHGRERVMPAAYRSDRALAEAQLARDLYLAGDGSLTPEWTERVEPRPGASVHVFAVTIPMDRRGPITTHLAIGPYPEMRVSESPIVVWWEELGADEYAGAARLAEAVLERRDHWAGGSL